MRRPRALHDGLLERSVREIFQLSTPKGNIVVGRYAKSNPHYVYPRLTWEKALPVKPYRSLAVLFVAIRTRPAPPLSTDNLHTLPPLPALVALLPI